MRDTSVRFGATLSYVAIGLSIVSGILVTPWIVHRLGQSDYGLMSLANSLGALLAVDLGLSAATTKFVAKYRAEADEEQYGVFLRTVFTAFLALDVVVLCAFGILWFFADSLMVALSPGEVGKLRLLLVVVGVQNVLIFPMTPANGILAGNERFASLKMSDLGMRVLSVGGTIVALLAGGGLTSVVVAGSAAVMAAFVFKLVRSWRLGLVTFGRGWSSVPAQMGVVARFAIWTTVITVAQRLSIGLAPALLGAFAGAAAVAVFGVAAMLEGYVWLLAHAVNGLFLARVTRLVSAGSSGKEELARLAIRLGRFQLLILGLVYLGFVFAGRDFIALWLGSSFRDAYVVALLLIGPSLFTYTQEVFRLVLISTDRVKWNAFGWLVSVVLGLPLTVVLVPRFGALGAGIAVGVGTFVGSCVFMNVAYYLLGLSVKRFFSGVHLALLPALAVSGVLFFGVDQIVRGETWASFLLKGTTMVVCYAAVVYVLGLNGGERGEIRGIAKRRFKQDK